MDWELANVGAGAQDRQDDYWNAQNCYHLFFIFTDA